MTQPYYPNLDGKVSYDVAQGIRTAYDFIHKLTARIDQLEKANYVTRDQALTHLGPSSLRKQLQVTGSSPLNVTGLAGQLAQPQIADAERVTALPPITDPLSQDGTLVSLNDQVYRFDGTTDPGTWKPITAAPAPGTSVTSLDTLTGPVTLVAGSNVTISDNVPLAGDITISATGAGGSSGGSGFPGIDGLDGEDAFAIPGAQGPQGNPGATGPQGPAGLGIDAQDPDEPMLVPGAQGPSGSPGATGATGPAGPMGLGIDGLDGEEGMAIPGPPGPSGGGGGGAWTLISKQILAAPAATITFSAIPATYNHLVLQYQARTDDAGVNNSNGNIRFNADTGANYDTVYAGSANNVVAAFTAIRFPMNTSGASATANTAGDGQFWIHNYTGTTFWKGLTGMSGVCALIGNTGTWAARFVHGHWRNTAAITQIDIVDDNGGNFVIGSAFYLYGVV